MAMLSRLAISGYKSIRRAQIELRAKNVLIGANGAGKSNLVSFFRLMNDMMALRLQSHVAKAGGAHSLLFYGAKTTPIMDTSMEFDSEESQSEYHARLEFAAGDTLIFGEEWVAFRRKRKEPDRRMESFGDGHRESRLFERIRLGSEETTAVALKLDKCRPFHFHDTSPTASLRQSVDIHDNVALRHDAGNLAAVLYRYKGNEQLGVYWRIVKTIQLVAPWFDDFILEPSEHNRNTIVLRWRERDSEIVLGPHQLSDGTLRAMALITLLLQPEKELPSLLVVDEPELGLHPYSLSAIAGLLQAAACHCQVLVATQSASLVDEFDPDDVIVVERDEGASVFRRLNAERLNDWLEEYSLGELWQKNVFGGGPF